MVAIRYIDCLVTNSANVIEDLYVGGNITMGGNLNLDGDLDDVANVIIDVMNGNINDSNVNITAGGDLAGNVSGNITGDVVNITGSVSGNIINPNIENILTLDSESDPVDGSGIIVANIADSNVASIIYDGNDWVLGGSSGIVTLDQDVGIGSAPSFANVTIGNNGIIDEDSDGDLTIGTTGNLYLDGSNLSIPERVVYIDSMPYDITGTSIRSWNDAAKHGITRFPENYNSNITFAHNDGGLLFETIDMNSGSFAYIQLDGIVPPLTYIRDISNITVEARSQSGALNNADIVVRLEMNRRVDPSTNTNGVYNDYMDYRAYYTSMSVPSSGGTLEAMDENTQWYRSGNPAPFDSWDDVLDNINSTPTSGSSDLTSDYGLLRLTIGFGDTSAASTPVIVDSITIRLNGIDPITCEFV